VWRAALQYRPDQLNRSIAQLRALLKGGAIDELIFCSRLMPQTGNFF